MAGKIAQSGSARNDWTKMDERVQTPNLKYIRGNLVLTQEHGERMKKEKLSSML